MQFVWLGLMKEPTEPSQQVQQQTNEFLEQPFIPIRAAGALRDADGKRAGMMMIFEAESREAAEALARSSPFLKAGLYDQHLLLEFRNEVG
jgi:uncharacterized protein YciI